MKSSATVYVVIAIIAALGIGAYVFGQKPAPSDTMMEDKMMMDDKMTQDSYVPYSKTAFDAAAGTRRVLFFYANWCPTCKPADASFTQNMNQIPEDVTVIRVNYNDPETDQEEKDLAKQYGVTYQHTFVQIDATGAVVTKWNGGQLAELLSKVQ